MFCAQVGGKSSWGRVGGRLLLIAIAVTVLSGVAAAQNAPLGGFIPFVGIGLTDEFTDSNGADATFFIAKPEESIVGTPLSGSGSPYYDLALLDTGAATHILTPFADGPGGFNINGNGFGGANFQQIGGATGLIDLEINDPLAIFATGLGQRTGAGAALQLDTSTFRGQSSVATLSAPAEWTLPNILGLPMAAQHAIAIRNDEPQVFELGGRTVRTPEVEFLPLGSGDQQGIQRRLNLKLNPGVGFIQGPLYVQDISGILNGQPFHENPLSPTVVENAGLFVDVDFNNGAFGLQDTELLFDTGASLTVVSEQTAVRLGFDPILDTPDFVLQVEGSGGVQDGIPGFYVEELRLDTVGGGFVVENVPIAVLDVANPTDPGNILPGILGTNVFNGRNLVIDANPAIGQGGTGPSLFISDPVTETHVWTSPVFQTGWQQANNWSAPGVPGELWSAELRNELISEQFVSLQGDSTVFELVVAAPGGRQVNLQVGSNETLTTFGETRLETGGHLVLINGKIDAGAINIDGGVLRGRGEVFVGNGPITGQVRNLSGRIEVGSFADGELAIDGDLSNLDDGTIAFQIDDDSSPLLSATRFAFLGGTLEVDLVSNADLMIGDLFTLITTGEGVVGEFDNLVLPSGFDWGVQYNANSVVLELLGIGLPGDFNNDSLISAADYTAWRDGAADPSDYNDWTTNFGNSQAAIASATVPEPTAVVLCLMSAALVVSRRR